MNCLVFFAAILLLGNVAAAATGIVIVLKVESAGQTGEITLLLDHGKARADLSPNVSLIVDAESGEQISLMHQNRKFLRMTAAEGAKLSDAVKKDRARRNEAGAENRPRLNGTSRTVIVSGQKTEIYKFETGSLKATYWIARDFPDATTILNNLEIFQKSTAFGVLKDRMPSPSEFPGMPLKTEIVIGDRKVTNTLISVIRRKIDPAVFEIPENYSSIYMGGRDTHEVNPGMKKPASQNP